MCLYFTVVMLNTDVLAVTLSRSNQTACGQGAAVLPVQNVTTTAEKQMIYNAS